MQLVIQDVRSHNYNCSPQHVVADICILAEVGDTMLAKPLHPATDTSCHRPDVTATNKNTLSYTDIIGH